MMSEWWSFKLSQITEHLTIPVELWNGSEFLRGTTLDLK